MQYYTNTRYVQRAVVRSSLSVVICLLQHYRNVMKCMQLIQINTEHDDDDYEALSHIVHEMQVMAVVFFYVCIMCTGNPFYVGMLMQIHYIK